MSNSTVRLTFPDGTQLYTYGDSWSVCSTRLSETDELALYRYNNDYNEETFLSDEELARSKNDAERVVIETTYGDRNREFHEMLTCFCYASKSKKLITYGPSYEDVDD